MGGAGSSTWKMPPGVSPLGVAINPTVEPVGPRAGLKVKVKLKSLSGVWLFATPWTVAHQAPPSMGLSRQEYWSGLPFPSPGDLPDQGIEPVSPRLQADALPSGKPRTGLPQVKDWKIMCSSGRSQKPDTPRQDQFRAVTLLWRWRWGGL